MIYVSDINLKNAIRLTLHVDKWGLRYVELQQSRRHYERRCILLRPGAQEVDGRLENTSQ